MFRSNKGNDKKLLEKIEDQEQKIVRYETRLRGEIHTNYIYLWFKNANP